MANLARSEIIRDNAIGNGLDEFRSIWAINALQQLNALDLDALDQLDKQRLRNTIRAFLKAAQNLPAADLLPATHRGTLRRDLLLLELSLLDDDGFALGRFQPLLTAALADHVDDASSGAEVTTPSGPFSLPRPRLP